MTAPACGLSTGGIMGLRFLARSLAAAKALIAVLCLAAPGFAQAARTDSFTAAAPAVTRAPAPAQAPSVQSVVPSALTAGGTHALVLTGSGLDARAVVSFGSGIEVVGVPQIAGGQLRLMVRVAPNAMPGMRIVRVSAGNQSGRGPASVTVIPATTPPAGGTQGAGSPGMLPPPPMLQPPAPERRAAPATPARSTASPSAQPAVQPSVGPVVTLPFAPPAAKLAFGLPVVDQNKPAWGSTELSFDKNSAHIKLVWQTASPAGHQWRWQIAAQPFPAGGGAPPAGLLDEGEAAYDHFPLDLTAHLPAGTAPPQAPTPKKKSFPKGKAGGTQTESVVLQQGGGVVLNTQAVFSALPTTFHIRLAAFKDGKAAGPVSNAVIARYQPGISLDQGLGEAIGKTEAQKQQALALLEQAKKTYELKILSFKPAIFEDPNRWGCVVVVSNPHFQKIPHPLAGFKPGKEYCPPVDPSTQEKSTTDWVWEGIKGYAKAWDGLSGYYNGAKDWLASQIADHVPCKWLGKDLQDDCKDAVKQMASYAISAGLVVVGLPPSLPDLSALNEAGKGKIADAAAEFSCDTFEANGYPCTPEVREKLKKYYKMALDELQKQIKENMKHQAHEPGCGDAQTAKEHGLLPLPCFTDFSDTAVKPATGSVYEPPRVKVRITRKAMTPKGVEGCNSLAVNLWLSNKFAGGTLSGKKLPPANVSGAAYKTEVAAVPKLDPGKSAEVVLDLNHMAPVTVPGNYWPDFYFPNWKVLYWGGKGTLSAGMLALADTGTTLGKMTGSCAAGDSWQIQIPQ